MKASASTSPLTSIRFFASAYIVLLHSFLWTGSFHTDTWLGRFERNGFVAVSFFFTLSGYVLAHVYLRKQQDLKPKKFLLKRLARLYPLLLLSLLLDVPQYLRSIQGIHSCWSYCKILTKSLMAIFLLQAWGGNKLLTLNPPSWAVSAEAFFYVCFVFWGFQYFKLSKKTSGLCIYMYLVAWNINTAWYNTDSS